ncbi:hypothetical protein QYF50_02015 [Paenibacillus vini]|uniref:hypothetical protein n=1 Tax=Paenibacillus vini TaxID=1476024 RepID=UPI0025B6F32D|nr:hypothetical protein [Paenibacillus vini]MDN4066656.1 hypothetical protein [Paenibacillus vini]
MRSNVAFKFIGRLSKGSVGHIAKVQPMNAALACIDAGIELIDMTSSIISYANEAKNTSIISQQITRNKLLLDDMVNQHKKAAEQEIIMAERLSLQRLEKLKLELSTEYEIICKHMDNQKGKLALDIEYDAKQSRIVERVRLTIKESLELSQGALEHLNKHRDKNKIQITSLEEQIRQLTAHYMKLVKMQ